jgi:DNA polymerase-3 subunit beta
MKVSCLSKDLETGILTAAKAVNSKSPLPILSHLLVKAEGDALTFSATDLEMVIECTVPAQIVEPGAFTAPARLLSDIVTQLPESDVSLELRGPQLELKTRSSHFLVNTLSSEEYPVLPQADGAPTLSLPAESFREMVKGVLFAVASPEETRAVLTGVLTQLEGSLATLVATDGRRLAKVQKEVSGAVSNGTYRAIIPARAMGELTRLLSDGAGTLEVTPSQGQVFFRFNRIQLVARLLEDGKFPDTEAIIPKTFARTVYANREQLLGSVRRALIMAQEKDAPRLLKLELSPESMAIRSNTPDLGEATEHLPVRLDGTPMTIAFNGRYLLDALTNAIGEEIQLLLNDALSMGMLRPVDSQEYLYLIMPVRVKDPIPEPVGA